MGQRIKRMELNDVAEGLSLQSWKPSFDKLRIKKGFRYILF